MITQAARRELEHSINRTVSAAAAQSSYWKILTLGILTSFAAGGFAYLFYRWLAHSAEAGWGMVFWVMIAFALMFLLQVILINRWRFLMAFTAIQAILLWTVFLFGSDWRVSLLGIALTLIFMGWIVYTSYREAQTVVQIRWFRLGRMIMSKFATMAALFMAMAYMAVAFSGSVSIGAKEILNSTLNRSSGLVENLYPGFSFDDTLRNNIEAVVEQRLAKNPLTYGLSDEQREIFVNQTILEYENYISDFFKTSFDIRNKTTDVLATLITTKFDQLVDTYGTVVYLAAILVVMVLVKGLAPVLYWPLLVVGFLIYQLLIAFGFVEIQLESSNREVIVLN